jgi:hypothetical protein
VAYTNNNQVDLGEIKDGKFRDIFKFQVIVTSMITGDCISIEPEALKNQMEIETIVFTNNNTFLFWSTKEYFIYNIEGKLIFNGTISTDKVSFNCRNDQMANFSVFQKLIHVFYKDPQNVRFVTGSGVDDNWDLSIMAKIDGQSLSPFTFSSALTFDDDRSLISGYVCMENESVTGKTIDLEEDNDNIGLGILA